MDRYYAETVGGHGWPKCHFVIDRSTVPHTVVCGHGWTRTRKAAEKLRDTLNANTDEFWTVEPAERDSLTRLREWAAQTKAFTEAPYDPNAPLPTSFVREAA
jgi:hypothetical protein